MTNNTEQVAKENIESESNPVRRTKKKAFDWQQRVVEIQRVSKVVKGGRKLNFRATIIIGNQKGQVGVGVGKADEIGPAIRKAVNDAKKNVIRVPITKTATITHEITAQDGATKVFIKPAAPGTGVIAGSSIRLVLELAGVQNVLAKQLGGGNRLNNARATVLALSKLRTVADVAESRDISLEKLFSYSN